MRGLKTIKPNINWRMRGESKTNIIINRYDQGATVSAVRKLIDIQTFRHTDIQTYRQYRQYRHSDIQTYRHTNIIINRYDKRATVRKLKIILAF